MGKLRSAQGMSLSESHLMRGHVARKVLFPLYRLQPFTTKEEKHEMQLVFGVFICQN